MRNVSFRRTQAKFSTFVCVTTLLLTMFFVKTLSAEQIGADKPLKAEVIQKTKKIQIPFITNNGQADERVAFYANTFGGKVFVTKVGEIVYSLLKSDNEESEVTYRNSKKCWGEWNSSCVIHNDGSKIQDNRESYIANRESCITKDGIQSKTEIMDLFLISYDNLISKIISSNAVVSNSHLEIRNPQSQITSVVIKEELVGGKIREIKGEEKSVTNVNYFKGNDSSKWKSNVATYDMVNLGEVYEGIQLKLKAYGNNVEKLFYVKPGATPETIQVQLNGAKSLKINEAGQLEAETELGTVTFTKPIAYQHVEGKRVNVDVGYIIQNTDVKCRLGEAECTQQNEDKMIIDGFTKFNPSTTNNSNRINPESQTPNSQSLVYGFKVASYDMSKELIIDPLLASTYLGGSYGDYCYPMIINSNSDVYIAGWTFSSDFPTTTGAFDIYYDGDGVDYGDVFISKLDSDLISLLASTYLGGYKSEYVNSIAIDSDGNIYLTGETGSSDFPTTTNSYDTSYDGYDDYYGDAFISKLSGDLSSLLASTFLGGVDNDGGISIAIDSGKNIYVVGWTYSSDFPTTTGAYDTSYNTSVTPGDAFISKLNGDLTSLLASTFLGGSDDWDYGHAIAIDSEGNIYVAGYAQSSDFPTTAEAYDTSNNGHDAFISKITGDLTNLLASTYLGGTDWDRIYSTSIAIDLTGNIYVTGITHSSDFPTTTGAYDTSFNGDSSDVFISKFNSELTNLLASTFLGGTSGERSYDISIDAEGDIYVTGWTYSADFPSTIDAYSTYFNKSATFISKLDEDLKNLLASTYLAGSSYDSGHSIVIGSEGSVYVVGNTQSSDFPTTSGAYDTSYNGNYDVFISKLDSNLSADATTPTFSPTPTPIDTLEPSGAITIINGDTYTNSTSVTLNLSATDDTGITGYYLSESSSTPSASASASDWTSVSSTASYSTSVSYTLSNGDGSKTIYVWYKDAAENISNSASDSITLDTTAPTVSITGPTSDTTYSTTSNTITLSGSASDSTSGIISVAWSNSATGSSGTASGTTSWSVSGIKLSIGNNTITITAMDNAGNTSTDTLTVTYTVTTITTPTPTQTTSETPTPTPTPTPIVSPIPKISPGTTPTPIASPIPTIITTPSSTTPKVAAGAWHSIVLKSDGTLWAWGSNQCYQLGIEENIENSTVPVQANSELTSVTDIATKGYANYAQRYNGTVWAWGCSSGFGELGYENPSSSEAVQVISGVKNIAAGDYHVLALKSDNTLWSWGYNGYGQLGDGTTTNSGVPKQINNFNDIIFVACGNFHSFAIDLDETVWAWGWNEYGQLGDGTAANKYTPILISNLDNVIAISGGMDHSIALKSDGTVWVWGRNNYGQLGDGSYDDSTVPIQVNDLSNVTSISCGYYHSMALDSDGTVWAWGENTYGQLGDGTNRDRNVPIQVRELNYIIDLAGGGYHSLALKSDGTVWAWGHNTSGQLGDGTTDDRDTPVQVDIDLGELPDTFPPDGAISINSGNTYTNSTTVTLNLSSTDDKGVTGYYVSESSSTPSSSDLGWISISSTTSYSEDVSYSLSSGDGSKKVNAWYKDSVDNVSDMASDSIVLDTTAPTVTITGPTSSSSYETNNSTIDVSGSASDATSGVNSVMWSNSSTGESGTASSATNWSISGVSLSSGDNVITVTATDNAGNESTDKITVKYAIPSEPTPTPPVSECPDDVEATTASVSPDSLALAEGDSEDVTVLVVDDNSCTAQAVKVKRKLSSKNKRKIKVSPASTTTDENGEATFTIRAKKSSGKARVKFSVSGVKNKPKVKVTLTN